MLTRVRAFVAEHEALWQFVQFCVVGATSAVIDGGLFAVFQVYLTVPWMLARTFSFTVAVINGFIWNRIWTFQRSGTGSSQSQFVKFLAINIVGLVLNLLIMNVMFYVQLGHLPHAHQQDKLQTAVAFIVATITVSVWNFVANKYWTFKNGAPTANEPAL